MDQNLQAFVEAGIAKIVQPGSPPGAILQFCDPVQPLPPLNSFRKG
jgi:hypothetical protein